MATGSSGRPSLRGDTADLLILFFAPLAAVRLTLLSPKTDAVPFYSAPELGVGIPDGGFGGASATIRAGGDCAGSATIVIQTLAAVPILIVGRMTIEGEAQPPGLTVLERVKWGEGDS